MRDGNCVCSAIPRLTAVYACRRSWNPDIYDRPHLEWVSPILSPCHEWGNIDSNTECLPCAQKCYSVSSTSSKALQLTSASWNGVCGEFHHQWSIGSLFNITHAADEIISSTNPETCLFVILEELEMRLKKQEAGDRFPRWMPFCVFGNEGKQI